MVTLDRLREDFAGTEAARMGLLFKAHLLYQTKKYADAARAYEDLLTDLKGTDTPGWKVLATESLSYCYEALGDYSRAAQVLQPVIDQVSGAYQGELLERLAFLFDQAGNAKEAQRSWERLLKEPRDPSRIPYLKEKLAEAEAKVKQGGK
jgi:tetratricopeptide (TPR) repeat protein